MAQFNLSPSQVEWLSRNMPHFGEMFLTNKAVRRDEALYKQGHLHCRNSVNASGRYTPVQLTIEHQPSMNMRQLPLFERIATVK